MRCRHLIGVLAFVAACDGGANREASTSSALSVFSSGSTPGSTNNARGYDDELGLIFFSDTWGTVNGVRFYKDSRDTGTHYGHLWTLDGTLLASVTFSGETASGWQYMAFPAPVIIYPGFRYIVSYHTITGFPYDAGYFTTQRDAPPLHVPVTGGVFQNGTNPIFPTLSYLNGNYWVDLDFTTGTGSPRSTLFDNTQAASSETAAGGPIELGVKFTTDVGGRANKLRFYKTAGDTGPHTGHLWDQTGALLATADFTNETASGWQEAPISVPIAGGHTYTASYTTSTSYGHDYSYFTTSLDRPPLHAPTAAGVVGSAGRFPQADFNGDNYWVDVDFTTATCTPSCTSCWTPDGCGNTCCGASSYTIWTPFDTPDTPVTVATPFELGTQFIPSVSGTITHLRFYRVNGNTGVDTGHLWAGDGTLLATATFPSSIYGWTDVALPSPVPVSAGQTYVASYFTTSGFEYTIASLWTGHVAFPLTVPAFGGVYGNATTGINPPTFPTLTYAVSNYWVDVVFQPAPRLPLGAACTADQACASGLCAGGVCCAGVATLLSATVQLPNHSSTNKTIGAFSSTNKSARVSLGRIANEPFSVIAEAAPNLSMNVQLAETNSVKPITKSNETVYPRAFRSRFDVIHRIGDHGTEDFIEFTSNPGITEVTYRLQLGKDVAGLRFIANVLELLDGDGIPRLRMSPPWLKDADGKVRAAVVSLDGCDADANPAVPWLRAPRDPGSRSCNIHIHWSDSGLRYPMVLDPAWATTASMAVARYGHSSVLIDGPGVLVFGGAATDVGNTIAEIFNPAAMTWTVTGNMNHARYRHTTTLLHDGRVLAAGGSALDSLSPDEATAEVYDPSTGVWTPTGTMAFARSDHAAAILGDGRVIVTGGAEDTTTAPNASASVEIWDPATGAWTLKAPMNEKRIGHSATPISSGTKVLVAGGLNPIPAFALDTVEVYDVAQNRWTDEPSLAYPHAYHAGVAMPDGSVLVAGGKTTDSLSAIEVFNLTNWATVAYLEEPKSGMAAFPVASYSGAFFVGGIDTYNQPIATIEGYLPALGEIVGLPMSKGRAWPGANWLPDSRLFVNGGVFNLKGQSDSEILYSDTFYTDQSQYIAGEPIYVLFSDRPAGVNETIRLLSHTQLPIYVASTNGAGSGVRRLPYLPVGNYEVSLYNENQCPIVEQRNAPFTVVLPEYSTVTTSATYTNGAPITVSFSNTTGRLSERIGIAPTGSSATTVTTWRYTNAATSGQLTFPPLPPGSYVARLCLFDQQVTRAESQPFTVSP